MYIHIYILVVKLVLFHVMNYFSQISIKISITSHNLCRIIIIIIIIIMKYYFRKNN